MDVSPYWNFDDPAASEAAFRRALAERPGGDDALTLQTQIARTLSLRSRFAEAHVLLDTIEPQLAGAGAEPRVRWLLAGPSARRNRPIAPGRFSSRPPSGRKRRSSTRSRSTRCT